MSHTKFIYFDQKDPDPKKSDLLNSNQNYGFCQPKSLYNFERFHAQLPIRQRFFFLEKAS